MRGGTRARVGVDVGGTKVLAVVVDEGGVVRRRLQTALPAGERTPAVLEETLTRAVADVVDRAPLGTLEGVGLSLAGLVDTRADLVRYCTHLPWRDDPVRDRLADRWGTRVVVENDATCAAVAEHRLGAAQGVASFVLVTLGTGIGGALVVDGEVWRGAGGMAGEFGHAPVVPAHLGGLACTCGLRGCWEMYCSGHALRRWCAEHAPERTDLRDGPEITAAAVAGDAVALRAFDAVGTWLGRGLAGLVAGYDPELLVVGGGVSAAGDLLLDPARAELERATYAATHRRLPPLVQAECGPEAGAVGAALLL